VERTLLSAAFDFANFGPEQAPTPASKHHSVLHALGVKFAVVAERER
jgi:hypothetical protein